MCCPDYCDTCKQDPCECSCWVCGGTEGMFWDGELLACKVCLPTRAPWTCPHCGKGPGWGSVCIACSESIE